MFAVFQMDTLTWFYLDIWMNTEGPFPRVYVMPGGLYYAYYVMNAIVVIVAFILGMKKYRKSIGVEKKRTLFISIGSICPWITMFLKICGLSFGYDLNCFGIFLAILCFGYCFIQYGYFNSSEIAYENALNCVNEGILVTNSKFQVLFMNQMMELLYPKVQVNEDLTQNIEFKKVVDGDLLKLAHGEQWYELHMEPLVEEGYVQGYTLWAIDMTHYYKMYNEVLGKSTKDALTGLNNREYFQVMVMKRLHDNASGAIFMIDVDDFKSVNDTYGHQMGDQVLITFAQVLQQCTTDNDLVCRIGGDEFMAYIHGIVDKDKLSQIAENIIQTLRQKLIDNECPNNITVSIGIAMVKDTDNNFDILYRHADKVLYLSKNKGKNTYYIYD